MGETTRARSMPAAKEFGNRSTGNLACKGLIVKAYPKELEEWVTLPTGGRFLLRPIRPEDEEAHLEFFTHLSKQDVFFRFFGLLKGFTHAQIVRYTRIDYDREMAFIAVGQDGAFKDLTVGVARIVKEDDSSCGEFAIVVRTDLKGKGLGYALLDKLVRYCESAGLAQITGEIMADNQPMLDLAKALGFRIVDRTEPGVVRVSLEFSK
jgi:acetyltransferase